MASDPALDDALSSANAELQALIESVGRPKERLARLAQPFLGTEREDVVSAVYESERLLRSAERALERAARSAR